MVELLRDDTGGASRGTDEQSLALFSHEADKQLHALSSAEKGKLELSNSTAQLHLPQSLEITDINDKHDTSAFDGNKVFLMNSEQTPASTSNFMPSRLGTDLRNPAIAAGAGLVGGGLLTAAGEYGLIRTIEPVARTLGAIAFAPLSGRAAGQILFAPPIPWYETLTPRPILIGAAIGAAAALAGYEIFKHKD